jgi:nucleotide-binding universal stress UspA family protein
MTTPSGERIIVGVDDSPGGVAALYWAVHRARSRHCQLVAVRAWALKLPPHGGRWVRDDRHRHVVVSFAGSVQRSEAAEVIRRCFQLTSGGIPADVATRIATPEGDPGVVLTGMAERDGDLLVVGTRRGHLARQAVHGSVSRYCARHASCPVAVIPAPHQRGLSGRMS